MGLFDNKEESGRSLDEILAQRQAEQAEHEDVTETCEKNEEAVLVGEKSDEVPTTIALKCFGWDEAKTEKWLIQSAKIWYAIMSFIWFLFGAFTFAPILFITQKIGVVFHKKKTSLFASTLIYLTVIAVLIFAIVFRI